MPELPEHATAGDGPVVAVPPAGDVPIVAGPIAAGPIAARPTVRAAGRASSPLARWGFAVFAVGLVSVAVIMVLFATGSHDLPLWLNLAAMLAPIGFGIGLLGVVREARSTGKEPGRNGGPGVADTPGLFPTAGRS